jgi:hypothetical protein
MLQAVGRKIKAPKEWNEAVLLTHRGIIFSDNIFWFPRGGSRDSATSPPVPIVASEVQLG